MRSGKLTVIRPKQPRPWGYQPAPCTEKSKGSISCRSNDTPPPPKKLAPGSPTLFLQSESNRRSATYVTESCEILLVWLEMVFHLKSGRRTPFASFIFPGEESEMDFQEP